MQFEQDGLTLWFGTPDAPAPEATIPAGVSPYITIGVKPQDAGHQVSVAFRVNGGQLQTLSAGWIRSDFTGLAQYFRAQFPAFSAGDRIEYTPVCVSGVRKVPPETFSNQPATSFSIADARDLMEAVVDRGSPKVVARRTEPQVERYRPAPDRSVGGKTSASLSTGPQMQIANRKLLVSVFSAQEAREAVLGGGRIIDSEDPRSALGNIRPMQIMAVSDAVLDFKRDLDVQLSTNIGEDQLLFDRSPTGRAIEKSPYEIAGKASQAAIGVACSMGTRVHPCNIVKVGLDGMELEKLTEVLSEVVITLRRTENYSHTQVMAVLFAQDLALWEQRKSDDAVRRVLVELREFFPSGPGRDSFDLRSLAVGTLRDSQNRALFGQAEQVSLGSLVSNGVLPSGSNDALVELNPLFDHNQFFPGLASGNKTNRAVIQAMVDATADSGAQAIMLDTSILIKVSNVCLVDTSDSEMVDLNRFRISNGMLQQGILHLDDIRFFVDYCHYRGVAANVAGSLESYQAQQLWVLVPELDQLSTRGAASAVDINPTGTGTAADTRQHRVIKRNLVRGLAPPEHGGVLNLPAAWLDNADARSACHEARELIASKRRDFGWPDLETYFVNSRGQRVASMDEQGRLNTFDR
jgi:uncharacterized protein (UPF0264 family)